jgi:tubby-related protein 1
MKRFLTTPLPREAGVVQCYIERNKAGLSRRMYPEYQLYMKHDDRFLLVGKKRPKQKTSNYLISMDASDLRRDGDAFLGKLRSNFLGTEFTAYDDGANPKERAVKRGVAAARREIGIVTYASNVMGSKGPRKMRVCIPRLDPSDGTSAVFSPTSEEDSMVSKFKAGHTEQMESLINKPPKWNEQVGAYVLNFNGRVTMASVKNFQLCSPEDHETVILQFGRVGKSLFTMDVRYPLTLLQAFSICLSSFDYKLACE